MESTDIVQFDRLKSDITLLVAPIKRLAVVDVATAKAALETVQTVKGYLKQVEAKRDELVRPLNQRVKLVNSYSDEIKAPLLDAEKFIKAEIVAFERTQEELRNQKRKEEEKRFEAERQRAAAEAAKIAADLEAKKEAALAAIAEQEEAAEMFGTHSDADAERRRLEEQLKREAADKEAQLTREAAVREQEAKGRQWDIDATRVKNMKKVWKYDVLNLELIPRQYLLISPNKTAILAAARGGVKDIPGVKLWQESELSIGANTSLKTLEEQSRPTDWEKFE